MTRCSQIIGLEASRRPRTALWSATLLLLTAAPCALAQGVGSSKESLPKKTLAFQGLENPREQEGPSDYILTSWNVEDGLPRAGVFSLAQTPDGYLWIGTEAGVARFDGARFKVFSPYDTPEMVRDRIASLFVDKRGGLWIGSTENGVCLYENGRFKEIGPIRLQRHRVFSFAEDRTGTIWVGVEDGLCFIHGNELKPGPIYTKVKGAVTHKVAFDSYSGRIYCCYWEDAGAWKDGVFTPLLEVQSEEKVTSNCFTPRHGGGLWFLDADPSRYGALRQLLPGERVTPPQPLPFPVPRWSIGDFIEDRSGNLWIGVNDHGLYRIGSDGVYERFEIGNKDVRALYEDNQGTIWAGSASAGLTRLKRRVFGVVPDTDPAPIGTVCQDLNGSIVFTTAAGDAFRCQDRAPAKLPLIAPLGLFIDREGSYWSSQYAALKRHLQIGSEFNRIASVHKPPLRGARVFFQSRQGALWFGSTLGGLGKFADSAFADFPLYAALYVRAIAEDGDGTIWTGHLRTGLRRFKDGEVQDYGMADGLPSSSISALYIDAAQVLWIGTLGGGLSRLENGRFTNYSRDEGLPSNEICGIIEVSEHLWLGTTKGIARIEKRDLNNFAAGEQETLHCQVFGTKDGLASAECVPGFQPNVCRGADGRLWFATMKGLAVVDPERVHSNEAPPRVFIEEVFVDDVPQRPEAPVLTVPPGTARLEVRYTGIDLAAPSRVRFQYRLDGHDADWIEAWNRRVAYYTKLRPGSYQFQVRAANRYGFWSQSPASIRIQFLPYFWQTGWFKAFAITLAAAVGTLAVWSIIHAKYRRQLERAERVNAVERERSRIARDLHDQLGAQVTQITLQSQLLQQISQEHGAPGFEQARRIARAADQLNRGMDEAVWAANPAKDNLESTVAFMTSYAEEFFRGSPARLRIDVPIRLERVSLPADKRHELFLAAKEALTNVLKHAQAREVWLRMHAEERQLIVIIEDDGKGLGSPASGYHGDGLKNMKTRLTNIGGTLEISSRAPSGTTVSMKIQL